MAITQQISCKIPLILWERVKQLAKLRGISATAFLTKAIMKEIAHYEADSTVPRTP